MLWNWTFSRVCCNILKHPKLGLQCLSSTPGMIFKFRDHLLPLKITFTYMRTSNIHSLFICLGVYLQVVPYTSPVRSENFARACLVGVQRNMQRT